MQCREVSTTGFQAELNGYRVFWDCLTHVLFLHGTHRFVDKSKFPPEPCPVFSQSCHSKPALGLFEYMRDPGGKKIPMHLWNALQGMRCTHPRIDKRLQEEAFLDPYELAIVWDVVTRLQHYRALREAGQQGKMLMYNQQLMSASQKSCRKRSTGKHCKL